MKNNQEKIIKRKKEEGITLIALVITIVILIILSTVTISVVFGEGGLISQAKISKEMSTNSVYYEEQKLNEIADKIDEIMTNDIDDVKPIELSYITAEYQEEDGETNVTPNKNEIFDGMECTINKFIVKAYYTDGSSKQVLNATINKEGITPKSEGLDSDDTFKVTVTYTENGIIKTVDVDLNVIHYTGESASDK